MIYELKTIHGTALRSSGPSALIHSTNADLLHNLYLVVLGQKLTLVTLVERLNSDRYRFIYIHDFSVRWEEIDKSISIFTADGLCVAANPFQSDREYLPLATREIVGPWETFSIINARKADSNLQERLDAYCQILERRPSLSQLIADETNGEFDDGLGANYITNAFDWTEILQNNCPVLALRLRQLPIEFDPWFACAVPDMLDWIRSEKTDSIVSDIGSDLDVIAHVEDFPPTRGRIVASQIRKTVTPTKGVCILATAKNEGPYLLEWAAYHYSIGVEHIFLYSNNNDDKSERLFAALQNEGRLSYVDNKITSPILPQYKSYAHALGFLPQILEYSWVVIIDLDEYFAFDAEKFSGILDYANWQSERGADAIALNWCWFGSYDELRYDETALVTTRYTKRWPEIEKHIKCMCRPQLFDHAHAHYPHSSPDVSVRFNNGDGDRYISEDYFIFAQKPIANSAWVNHYFSKSIDDFLLKASRNPGDRVNVSTKSAEQIADEIYRRVLWNDEAHSFVEDHRIRDCASQLANELYKLLLRQDIWTAQEAILEFASHRISQLRRAVYDFASKSDAPQLQKVAKVL